MPQGYRITSIINIVCAIFLITNMFLSTYVYKYSMFIVFIVLEFFADIFVLQKTEKYQGDLFATGERYL